jgi:hypothetical protein
VSFFDRPAGVTRFRMVHALWRRQRVGMLPGVAPVALVLARTDDTAVGPDQPVLVEAGIGGEGGRLGRGAYWDLELAVQPLPPPGPLAFVCAWPGRGVPESRVEIDAGLILDAAAAAVPFFASEIRS